MKTLGSQKFFQMFVLHFPRIQMTQYPHWSHKVFKIVNYTRTVRIKIYAQLMACHVFHVTKVGIPLFETIRKMSSV